MKRLVIPIMVMVAALFFVCAADAQDKKKGKAAQAARLKVIIKKLDPEISAAQKALRNAKAKLQVALNDEVLKEKGAVEGKVIDQLKVALKNVDNAIKAANKAQKIDPGGD